MLARFANVERKKLLLTALTLVVAAVAVGGGAVATFNAQVGNNANKAVFADGTIVLSNTKQSGTTCFSTGAGTTVDAANTNDNCEQLFNFTVRKPGDTGTVNFTVRNEGTVPATVLRVFSNACTAANVAAETYHGTGDPCSQIQLYVQKWSTAYATPTDCVYGSELVANTCDFSGTPPTLADFVAANGTAATGEPIVGGLAAGASGFFTIGVKLPQSANNTYQGRQSAVDFTWFAEQ